MFKKEFASSYTSFDSTGAAYITKHTNIKLVGIDYLSIGCLEDIVETHRVLLGNVSSEKQDCCRAQLSQGPGSGFAHPAWQCRTLSVP
jgi:kynurenine formamidase